VADLKRYLTNPSLIAEGFFRQISSYSVFQNKSEFKVRVLSTPQHYAGPDYEASVSGDTEPSSKWWFKGRITDINMPHEKFLPDPCDESIAADKNLVKALVAMHSTVFSEGKPDCDVGDIISAFIEPGDNNMVYNVQNLKYLKVETQVVGGLKAGDECFSLSGLFDQEDSEDLSDYSEEPDPNLVPSGDTLQAAYFSLEKQKGSPMTKEETAKYVYTKMIGSGLNENIVLGIMANAYAESGFNEYIVSKAAGESSLGLWQCNVGSRGKYEDKRATIREREKKLPEGIRLKEDFGRIPYFAGSLIYGDTVVSTSQYANDPSKYEQKVAEIYEKVINKDNQINFVISTANEMLDNLNTEKQDAINAFSAADWADWWLVYFEQPGAFHSRGGAVSTVEELIK